MVFLNFTGTIKKRTYKMPIFIMNYILHQNRSLSVFLFIMNDMIELINIKIYIEIYFIPVKIIAILKKIGIPEILKVF